MTVSVIAWGHPLHPRTFSGYSPSLVKALQQNDVSVECYSAKNLRYVDALRGAVGLRSGRFLPTLQVSQSWMWGRQGNPVLERRMADLLRKSGSAGPFLQIGTLVDVPRSMGPHYVLTDMTIPQACEAGFFAISQLKPAQLKEAIDIQRRIFTNSAHAFVLSDWTRESVLRDFNLPEDRVTTVYAGANLDFSDAGSSAARKPEILFVGIDWARKGGPLLLDAFERVRLKIPNATLRIVGCSPQVSRPGVFVEGFLSRKNPAEFQRLQECYREASCFCLPSLFDPFPNAILEASAAGLPSVAIDNGSRREAIIDGVTGCLAPTPDANQLAAALLHVLSDDDRALTMGDAARELCRGKFTWDSVVSKITSVMFGDNVGSHQPEKQNSMALN